MKRKYILMQLIAFVFILASCSKFSQIFVHKTYQEKLFERLNGIKDKADVEGYGILEYELYDAPGNEYADFQMFIRNYTQALNEYIFDWATSYWVEDNTGLSENVKAIMTKHKRNISTTKTINPNDGSTRFLFNCLNSDGKYEIYAIYAYKKNKKDASKITKKLTNHGIAEEQIKQGWVYYWKEDYDNAIASFSEAIRLDPKCTEVYNIRGWVYYCKGEYNLAISDFSEMIRLYPKSVDAYFGRSNTYFNIDEYDKAIDDYNKLIKLYPKFLYVYINRGWAYFLKKDYDKAIIEFTEVIRLDPKVKFAHLDRGMVYYLKKEYSRAIKDFDEVIRLDPESMDAYYWRGLVYYDEEAYEPAIKNFTEAIRLDLKYKDAYYWRGCAYYDKEDYEHAIADYEEVLRLDPNNTEIRQEIEDAKQMLQSQKEKK